MTSEFIVRCLDGGSVGGHVDELLQDVRKVILCRVDCGKLNELKCKIIRQSFPAEVPLIKHIGSKFAIKPQCWEPESSSWRWTGSRLHLSQEA